MELVQTELLQTELVRTELALVQPAVTVIAKLRFVTSRSLPFVLNMPSKPFYTVINVGLEYLVYPESVFNKQLQLETPIRLYCYRY